jgi:hypothetical protein
MVKQPFLSVSSNEVGLIIHLFDTAELLGHFHYYMVTFAISLAGLLS